MPQICGDYSSADCVSQEPQIESGWCLIYLITANMMRRLRFHGIWFLVVSATYRSNPVVHVWKFPLTNIIRSSKSGNWNQMWRWFRDHDYEDILQRPSIRSYFMNTIISETVITSMFQGQRSQRYVSKTKNTWLCFKNHVKMFQKTMITTLWFRDRDYTNMFHGSSIRENVSETMITKILSSDHVWLQVWFRDHDFKYVSFSDHQYMDMFQRSWLPWFSDKYVPETMITGRSYDYQWRLRAVNCNDENLVRSLVEASPLNGLVPTPDPVQS